VTPAATRGRFISFEGGEASGKSVQAKRLADALRGRGLEVVLVREPGGTPAGERIREILLHGREIALTPEAQALLFSASRAQLVRETVRPALERGAVVIVDRYFDSTLAYQGAALGADDRGLREITRFAVGSTIPDKTFLLDVPVDVILERGRARSKDRTWDRYEVPERDLHDRVREGYLALARAEPGRFAVIRGDREESEVAKDVLREVDALLATISRR
jgi:dTMP kinase